ncbi:hypothetical protein ACFPK1_18890 [Actinomycetospora rhizophila]|uniref:Addiction module component n=1 Tax=Actinomycetospora rhizophila TaxID=1416876 RepID=A0ABV9ZFY1_9PSEU
MTDDELGDLADAVDEALEPATPELLRDVWPTALAELAVEDAFRQAEAPSPETIIEKMRQNGLEDPEG